MESESGVQLFIRFAKCPSLKTLANEIFPNGLAPREIVEISGKSGTGKSEFLLHVIAQCILPEKWNNFILNGLGCSVAYVDCDYHFDMLRFLTVLENMVSEAILSHGVNVCDNPSDAQKAAFVKSCLQRLHLFKCSSSFQLSMTLNSLEEWLKNCIDMRIMIIDSISAFYWWERMLCNDYQAVLSTRYKNIFTKLSHIISEFELALVMTKQLLMKSDETEHEFLAKDWQKFITTYVTFNLMPSERKGVTSVLSSYKKKDVQLHNKFIITNVGIKWTFPSKF